MRVLYLQQPQRLIIGLTHLEKQLKKYMCINLILVPLLYF